MAHTWWHVWGEIGKRSNKTLDYGTAKPKKPFLALDVPDSFDLTETLDYTPKSLEPLYQKFNSPKNRGLGFKKRVSQKFENFEGLGPGHVTITDDKKQGTKTTWVPYMGDKWVEEQNQLAAKAEFGANFFLHMAPIIATGTGGASLLSRGNPYGQRGFKGAFQNLRNPNIKVDPFKGEGTGPLVNMTKGQPPGPLTLKQNLDPNFSPTAKLSPQDIAQLATIFKYEQPTQPSIVGTESHKVRSDLIRIPKDVDLEQLRTETIAQRNRALGTKDKDKRTSALATGADIRGNDERVYGLSAKQKKLINIPELDIKGSPNKQLHHEYLKGLAGPIVDQAWKLYDDGLATIDDIINLQYIALEEGLGLGDRRSAIAFMDKIPHDFMHELMLSTGIQPSPGYPGTGPITAKERKAIDDPAEVIKRPGPSLGILQDEIKATTDITELTEILIDNLQNIAQPMQEAALKYQDAWDDMPRSDKIRLIQLRNLRGELFRAVKGGDLSKKALYEETSDKYDALKVKLTTEMEKLIKRQELFKERLGEKKERRFDSWEQSWGFVKKPWLTA